MSHHVALQISERQWGNDGNFDQGRPDFVLVCGSGDLRYSISLGGNIRHKERMVRRDIGEGRLLRDLRNSCCNSV